MAGRETAPLRLSDAHELGEMEDIHVTPRKVHFDDDSLEDDDDDTHEDDGTISLLSPAGRTRGGERLSTARQSRWGQMKGTVIETLPTLLLTTLGLLLTGELLEYVSTRRAMQTVDELIILVPVILNLKGNLEMNLSARLGTAANLGDLDSASVRSEIITGNLLLLQVQAIVVSFVGAIVSFALGMVVPRKPSEVPLPPLDNGGLVGDRSFVEGAVQLLRRLPKPLKPSNHGRPKSGFREFMVLMATSMCSASLASLVLGSFMCMLVLVCRRLHLDPDNIAPPIAATLGDLVTLAILGFVCTILVFIGREHPIVSVLLSILFLILGALCLYLLRKNRRVRPLLSEGWSPLFGAMAVSCATGIVLDEFVSRYDGFAILAIMVGGLPGSVGSIFVSRLSTALHQAASVIGSSLPGPTSSRFKPNSGTAMPPNMRVIVFTLFLVTLPIEVIFLTLMRVLGWVTLPLAFLCFALIFFCVAVIASLVISQHLTMFLWSKGLDPDSYALPLQSSLVDLAGQLLLVACYELATAIGLHVSSASNAVAALGS